MKKSKTKNVPKVDPYLEGMMSKLVDRLLVLEKKIDTLMSKVGNLSANGAGKPQAQPQPPKHDRTLYEAICADCHKVCEVPFRPTEARPVYCKACWAKRKGVPAPGMPVLTPVSLPPKPVSKLGQPAAAPPAAASKKVKKSAPAKKAKKKKK